MEDLRDYVANVDRLNWFENEEFLSCAKKILSNLERQARIKTEAKEHLPMMQSIVSCHIERSRSFF